MILLVLHCCIMRCISVVEEAKSLMTVTWPEVRCCRMRSAGWQPALQALASPLEG
jgi:hypothetical protein